MTKKEKISKIANVIYTIIIIIIMFNLYRLYKKLNFNEYTKAESSIGITKFTRDDKIKYDKTYSYKIESPEFNDAIFYKKIKVQKNTPYKLSCMVKTKDVINENGKSGSGAQISIINSTECSESIIGTTEWQKLEFIFDSKNREELEIGFRLGGNGANSKGIAWFTDFKLEEGIKDKTTNWNIACFILENVDVMINNENIKLSMRLHDIETIKDNMERFKDSVSELSNNKMTVTYDVYEIIEPVKNITYSDEFAYYLEPYDCYDLIKDYLQKKEYDYIFVAVRLGDTYENLEIQVNDWIGLGGMDINGIGYSNIRLPNDSNSYIYTYNRYINTFPEEVFIHEFLHTLERILKERDFDIPALHDYQKYDYADEKLIGQKKWYKDYMSCNIDYDGKKIGLDESVYQCTPPAESDFKYSVEKDFFSEPQNIVEEVIGLLKNFKNIKNIFVKKN